MLNNKFKLNSKLNRFPVTPKKPKNKQRRQKKSNYDYRSLLVTALFSSSTFLPMLPVLAASPAPGTVIENQATGSFTDPNDGTEKQIESNTVTVTVAEVAGITITQAAVPEEAPSGVSGAGANQGNNEINPDDIIYFTYKITNVGNDPTQFFIPGAPSDITNGSLNGSIEIIEYDTDGAGTTAAVDLSGSPVSIPSSGIATGDAAALDLPNGSIPPDGTVTIRVPIKADSNLNDGDTVTVVMGDTAPNDNSAATQNQVYAAGTNDIYTQDNPDGTTGETDGTPINGDATNHRQEASYSQDVTVAIANLDYGDAPDASIGTGTRNYQTTAADNGASHTIDPNLYIGTAPDADDGTLQGDDADVDDENGNDEGSVSISSLLITDTSYSINNIAVTNNTGKTANLVGWVDFDQSGTFDADEAVTVAVPDGTTSVNLDWSTIPGDITNGGTYVRLRLTTDTNIATGDVITSSSVGNASDGEVEDYAVNISSAPVNTAFCQSPYGEVYSGGVNSDIYIIHAATGSAFRGTNQALSQVVNSVATDHQNYLVYYADGQAIYAWDTINNQHFRLSDSTGNQTASAMPGGGNITTLTSGGAAFFGGSLYLGIEKRGGRNSDTEVYRVDFVPGSNGRTIQSLTALGVNDSTGGANGGLDNADWGDMIIDDNGIILGATRDVGFWSFDPSTGIYNKISNNYLGQLAKDGTGQLWGINAGQIQPVDPTNGTFTGTASSTVTSADLAECAIGASSIGDRVWEDKNGDGVQDSGEPGIENVTVALYRDIDNNGTIDSSDPLLDTQTTDSNGNYDFPGVTFGNYIVRVTDTNGVLTNAQLTSASDTVTVTLPNGVIDYNDADFGYQIANTPNVLLVKRITGVNGNTTSNSGDDLSAYNNEQDDLNTGGNPYDDNDITVPDPSSDTDPQRDTDKWPPLKTFLIGGINGGTVEPNDELEYTIYFLSAGDTEAKSVLFCDRVPTNTTFIPTAFNSETNKATGGLDTADRGIIWQYNNIIQSLTNVQDGDAGQYFAPGVDPKTVYPDIDCGGDNTNGAVVVNLGDIPNATAPGVPTNSYGFVRFRGQVK